MREADGGAGGRPAGLPPGSSLGPERQTAKMVMRPLAFMEELRARFGEVFTVRVVDEAPWAMVSDPGLIAEVLKAPADVLHAGEGKEVLRPLLGDNSVLLLDEERHMAQRRLLLPPFSGSRIERYEEAMREAAEHAFDLWPHRAIGPVLIWTREIALETILRAVFGVGERERLVPLRQALRGLKTPANAREAESHGFREAIERTDALIFAEIDGRAAVAGGEERDDVLSLLLQARHEDGAPMSRAEIRDELMSLLIAGYETAATTLAWALERLARHPEALARAAEEAERGGGPFVEATIRETLRLRPALPIVARAVKAPYDLGEHRIPVGTTIVPAILLLHHRPDIYPEPYAFRPERFLEGPPDPHTWIPFGGGVRRCIGARFALQEMQIVLSTLLARATVRPPRPEPEPMRRRDVTLSPSRGVELVMALR